MYAGYRDYTPQDQEIFYDSGICLANQKKIADWKDLKQAIAAIYNNVEEIQQIVDLYLMMNGAPVNKETLPSDQLMDMIYKEIIQHNECVDLYTDVIALAAAYQQIFYIFIEISPREHSLAIFVSCLDSNYDKINSLDRERLQLTLTNFMRRFEDFKSTIKEIL
jgi:hypothetical protein